MDRFLFRLIKIVVFERSAIYGVKGAIALLYIIFFLVGLFIFIPISFPIVLFLACIYFNLPNVKRKDALLYVEQYLIKSSSIWTNLKLSNEYCSVELNDNKEIIIKSISSDLYNNKVYCKFKCLKNHDDWNKLCYEYNDHLMKANEVIYFFKKLKYENDVTIIEENETIKKNKSKIVLYEKECNNDDFTMPILKISDELEQNANKIDINNASEIEITALPGISIVLSKKLIQKREEIGGFKTVDEVFEFLKLKPHFETQLRKMICVNKMQGTIRIKKYKERKIDL